MNDDTKRALQAQLNELEVDIKQYERDLNDAKRLHNDVEAKRILALLNQKRQLRKTIKASLNDKP